MDKNSKLLMIVFFSLLIASALLIFYRTMILRDYDVITSSTHEYPPVSP